MTAGTAFPTARLAANWRYQAVNEAFLSVLRLQRDEVIGYTCWELFPGLDGSPVGRAMVRGMEARRPLSGRFATPKYEGAAIVLTVAPTRCGGIDVVWSYHDSRAQRPSAERVG